MKKNISYLKHDQNLLQVLLKSMSTYVKIVFLVPRVI